MTKYANDPKQSKVDFFRTPKSAEKSKAKQSGFQKHLNLTLKQGKAKQSKVKQSKTATLNATQGARCDELVVRIESRRTCCRGVRRQKYTTKTTSKRTHCEERIEIIALRRARLDERVSKCASRLARHCERKEHIVSIAKSPSLVESHILKARQSNNCANCAKRSLRTLHLNFRARFNF